MPLTSSASARSLETGPSTPPSRKSQAGHALALKALPARSQQPPGRAQRPSSRLADRVTGAEQPGGLGALRRLRGRAARALLAHDGAGVLLVLVLVLGLTLGLKMPADSDMPYPWNRVGEVGTQGPISRTWCKEHACSQVMLPQRQPWSGGRVLIVRALTGAG